MKNITTLFLLLVLIISCQDNSFKNWEKTENGYYQKTIIPYKYDWKRIDKVLTLNDTLNGTFDVYNNNGTINHRGELKDGKIYGNLYEYDTKERLKEYSFIWEDCGECTDLPPAHYVMEYDSIGNQKDVIGKAIIDWNIDQTKVRLKDSLEINVLVATPPFFITELVVIDKDSKAELKVISNPKNRNKIKVGFNSIGKKRLGIHYRLTQETSPTGMISTVDIENIIVTE
jgi:antitoxin component YwqK of YwqJK toxin-antitoxin module